MNSYLRILIVALAFSCIGTMARASEILAVDGDTILFDGAKVDLFGIKSPDIDQTCDRVHKRNWPCGVVAKKTLAALLSHPDASCDFVNFAKNRKVICTRGDIQINETLLALGVGTTHPKQTFESYKMLEKRAQQKQIGIWQ